MASASGNSERREYEGINASFENASENNRTLSTTHINDETRCNSHDGVSELPDPGTQFDRQSPTHYVPPGGSSEGHHRWFQTYCCLNNRKLKRTMKLAFKSRNMISISLKRISAVAMPEALKSQVSPKIIESA